MAQLFYANFMVVRVVGYLVNYKSFYVVIINTIKITFLSTIFEIYEYVKAIYVPHDLVSGLFY